MFDNHIPMFVNESSCAEKDYNPDWWHPQELAGRNRKWSHTPEADMARSICSTCPALMECREYSMKYANLTGIWAGMDRLERHTAQDASGAMPIEWTSTYESSCYSVPHERTENVQG